MNEKTNLVKIKNKKKSFSFGKTLLWAGTVLLSFYVGMIYATGSLPSRQAGLGYQAEKLRQTGELAWYIQSFNYEDVNLEQLYLGSSRGMVNSLDDKYATYYTGEEYAQLLEMQGGRYVGIGLTFMISDDDEVIVTSTNPDSPARKAGIEVDDILYKIDGKLVSDLEVDAISSLIRGFVDKFSIVVLRDGVEKTFTLKNEEIINHRVHFEIIDDVGVITLDEFNGDTVVEEFEDFLKEANQKNLEGVVIDLRDNPGGDLEVVLNIADLMLDDGEIMTMQSANGNETKYYSKNGKATDLPLAVLINKNSASASEVLAGALQDRDVATIIGTKSFGKGIVQGIYPLMLSDGHVKLTTSIYLTPNGHKLHGVGILPDKTIFLDAKYKDKLASEVPLEDDKQLASAIEYINNKK